MSQSSRGTMVGLDSPAWEKLQHAYGNASDIPQLLKQLEYLPKSDGGAEPWFSLWSALAHQGDVYPASFAAVPHIVQALSLDPAKASYDYFAFPTWVEICRQRQQLLVPEELSIDYFQAIASLAGLVSAAAARDWDIDMLKAAMSALAVSKGFTLVAEAAQEPRRPDCKDVSGIPRAALIPHQPIHPHAKFAKLAPRKINSEASPSKTAQNPHVNLQPPLQPHKTRAPTANFSPPHLAYLPHPT